MKDISYRQAVFGAGAGSFFGVLFILALLTGIGLAIAHFQFGWLAKPSSPSSSPSSPWQPLSPAGPAKSPTAPWQPISPATASGVLVTDNDGTCSCANYIGKDWNGQLTKLGWKGATCVKGTLTKSDGTKQDVDCYTVPGKADGQSFACYAMQNDSQPFLPHGLWCQNQYAWGTGNTGQASCADYCVKNINNWKADPKNKFVKADGTAWNDPSTWKGASSDGYYIVGSGDPYNPGTAFTADPNTVPSPTGGMWLSCSCYQNDESPWVVSPAPA